MAKITRKAPPKPRPAARSVPNKPKKAAAKPRPARKSRKPKPWTSAEVLERVQPVPQANPEPRGELEHLNPYTLLVAVVLSAQATDAGVNKATRALFCGRRYAGKDA